MPSSSYTEYTHTHTHPTLGPLTGRLRTHPIISPTAETVQFRSVPFATISARFKPAQGPLTSVPENHDTRPARDFTQWGYACPQVEQDRLAGGGSLGEDDVRQYDEFACLNCTVTAPRKALEGELKRLPVMVYLHGGAFVEGCGNISASHDTGRMVALSVEEGMPVVIVSLHYRLNWFGFVTSSDLLAEARDKGDGFVANLGLMDQRLGFQWVQRQIQGFGGDCSNITAFGESAGSISLVHHLCGTEPLFQRAILQSGIVGGPGDDLGKCDEMYERVLAYLDISEESPEARVEALRAAPVDRLVKAVVDLKLAPAWPYASPEDPFYANGPPKWSTIGEQLASCTWCTELVIGDSSFEGFMLLNVLLQIEDPTTALTALRSAFKPEHTDGLAEYYNLHPSLPSNLLWTNIARLAGDFAFSEPTSRALHPLAASPEHKVYRYQVCLSNPFPGSVFSYVPGHHFVEVMFLFLTYLERYPTHRDGFHARVAREMARRWIVFGNGRVPWDEFRRGEGGEQRLAVWDDLKGLDVRTKAEDEVVSKEDVWGERRYEGLELISKAFEGLADGDHVRGRMLETFL